jgi:hypothetical protein
MTRPAAHKWTFAPRFRRHAFGWRSQPALQRVREAVADSQNVAKKDTASRVDEFAAVPAQKT